MSDTPGYHASVVRKVLLASPRGYCAGVERAVETVEKALDLYGPPVYVRKQIVHNLHVVRDLEARGAIFVDEETAVPEGETVVFSAHGVAPSVHANAETRRLNTIDATCPLVTQTTLSVDETSEIISAVRRRYPDVYAPKKEDICYATSNQQWAVKEMLSEIDLLLVIGSRNSSNSNRLVEVARSGGVASHLIDDESEIDEAWVEGVDVVGVTSGASAPEKLVDRVCDWFRVRGTAEIEPYRLVDEDVEFRLPVELRRELALADAQR